MSKYPKIDDNYDIEVDNPDDPMDMPIASGRVSEIGDRLIDGDYTGTAWSHEGDDEVPVHVRIADGAARASHADDPYGVANPQRVTTPAPLPELGTEADLDGPQLD